MATREQELENELEGLKREKRQADADWRTTTTTSLREVSSQIQALMTSQQTYQTVVTDRLDTVNTNMNNLSAGMSRIQSTVTGNGEPEKGLVVRVDRLEQKSKSESKWTYIIGTAAIGALVTTVWNFFTKP